MQDISTDKSGKKIKYESASSAVKNNGENT